jgi:hypothetical protein
MQFQRIKFESIIFLSFLSICLFSIITILLQTCFFNYVFAFPPFERQELKVDGGDENSNRWVDLIHGKDIRNMTEFFQYPNPNDLNKFNNLNKLKAISYSSNGQYINTTFWLKYPFEPVPKGIYTPSYAILIDADSNNYTGSNGGIDYTVQILWNNKTNNWTYDLEETSITNQGRILEKINNYTGFYNKDSVAGNNPSFYNRYIHIPLNLSKISSIIQGKMIFLVEYDFNYHDNYYEIGYLSKWVPIPPPKIFISSIPNNVTIISPGKQNLDIFLESNNTALLPNVTLNIGKVQGIIVKNLTSNNLQFSPDGLAKAIFSIIYDKSNNEGPISDRLPISTTTTFPYFTYKNKSIPSTSIIAKSYVSLNLLPPIGFTDLLTNTWTKLGQSISGFYGLISSVLIGGFAIWRWTARNKKDVKRNNERKKIEKIFCRYCGKEILLSGDYCMFCGEISNDNFTSITINENNTMKQCVNCKTLIRDDSLFCFYCGSNL